MTTEEQIMKALEEVKRAGHGTVEVKIADHKVIYIERKIGEKVATK